MRNMFNPSLKEGNYRAVMAIINSVIMLTIIMSGSSFLKERKENTIELITKIPVILAGVVTAKLLAILLTIFYFWVFIFFIGYFCFFSGFCWSKIGFMLHHMEYDPRQH